MSTAGLNKFGKNVVLTFIRQGLSIIIGLGVTIILARVLGPEGNGIYGMAILLPTLLSTFLNLGIGPSNIYHLASSKTNVRTAFNTTIKLWAQLSFVGLMVGFAIIYFGSEKYFSGVKPSLLYASIWIFPILLLHVLLSSILQGIQDFKKFNWIILLTSLVNLLILTLALFVFNWSLLGALFSYCVGQLAGVLGLLHFLNMSEKKKGVIDLNYKKQCVKYGFKSHLSNMITFINYRADIFLVNYFLGPVYTGIYLLGVQIAEKLWIISHVVSAVLLPQLAELHTNEFLRKQLTPFVARWIFLTTVVASIVLFFSAKFIIVFFYGSEFVAAAGALIWLLPGICFGAASRVFANDIAARGKPELNFYIALIVVVLNLVLNIFLIPKYGIIGGAIATSIAYAILLILVIVVYSNITKTKATTILIPNEIEFKFFHILKAQIGVSQKTKS